MEMDLIIKFSRGHSGGYIGWVMGETLWWEWCTLPIVQWDSKVLGRIDRQYYFICNVSHL